MGVNVSTNDESDMKQSFGQSQRICMNIDIVLKKIAPSCHLTSLGQLYVYCSAHLATDCFVELPGVHQEVLCPLQSGCFRIFHSMDKAERFFFVLTLESFYGCQVK